MGGDAAVVWVSLGTALITTLGGVIVAALTSRKEAANSAEDAMEKVLRERLVQKDEQIEGLEHKVANRERQIEELRTERDELRLTLDLIREGRTPHA